MTETLTQSTAENLTACGVPARHARLRLDVSAVAMPWAGWFDEAWDVASAGGIAVLTGSRGSGKTQIGAEIIRRGSSMRPVPRYWHVMDVFLNIRASFGGRGDEKLAVDGFCKPAIAVIDEIQERGETEWEDRMLRYIIDRRYGAELGTVLIANVKREVLIESLGKSVSSRIAETGTFIECVGKNFRIKDGA